MKKLSVSEIENLLSQIESIRFLIDEIPADTIPDKLNQFENKLTLSEIESCLFSQEPGDIATKLCDLLSKRWERIRSSSMSYTESPLNVVNQFCLDLAKELYPIPKTENEINELPNCEGPYFILMPSLKASADVTGTNIHNLLMQQFILADNDEIFIPLEPILERASYSDKGEFEHYVSLGQDFPKLSDDELKRFKHHSTIMEEYIIAIEQLNEVRIRGNGLGANLLRLVNALRAGGAHGGHGEELNSGSQANEGISEFSEYWEKIPTAIRSEYLRLYPELNDALGRLFRPRDRDYRDVTFCVELIAEAIDNIITSNQLSTEPLEQFKREVATKKEIVERTIKSDKYELLPSSANSPKVYADILKPSIEDQQLIFPGYKSVWIYLLENDPSALVQFENLITKEMQQEAQKLRFTDNKTPLMIAAIDGCNQAVNLLLDMDVKIDEVDSSGNTALTHAVNSKKIDVVKSLLIAGARIEIKNVNDYNSLDYAEFNNQLDILELILLKAVSLDKRTQKKFLPLGYDSVFSYVVDKHFELIPTILREIIEIKDNDILQHNYVFTVDGTCESDMSALMIAVLQNQGDLVKGLVDDLGADIDEVNNDNNHTALIVAANYGKIDAVNQLLSMGAQIELKSKAGNTALNLAIFRGHLEVVEALLANGASLLHRNSMEENSLNLALMYKHELVKPLLLRAISLDADDQDELLRTVSYGPYANVLDYICSIDPALIVPVLEDAILNNNRLILDAKVYEASTMLMIAVLYGDNDLVCRLIDESNLKIDEQSNSNHNALIYAVQQGKTAIVSSLLSRNANIELQNDLGNTALITAVLMGHVDSLRALLAKNPKLTTRNNDQFNVLDIAITEHPECIDAILLQADDLSLEDQSNLLSKIADGQHKTVLSYAAFHKPYLVDQILNKTIELKNKDVLSEKIYINYMGQEMNLVPYILQNMGTRASSYVLRLIDEGMVDINDQDDLDGQTILHLAIHSNTQLALAILSREVNISHRDNTQLNVLDVAVNLGKQEIINALLLKASNLDEEEQEEFLAKLPINIDSKKNVLSYTFYYRVQRDFCKKLLAKILDDKNMAIIEAKYERANNTILMIAVNLQDALLVKRLIDEFAVDVNEKDIYLNTALYHAINIRNGIVVSLLLEKGANLTGRNAFGENALDLAFKNSFVFDNILLAGVNLKPSMQKELLARFGSFNDVLSYVLLNIPHLVMDVFKKIQPENIRLKGYIKQIHLLEHIEIIKAKCQEMVDKSIKNPKYKEAARVAKELTKNLVNETSLLLQNDSVAEKYEEKIAKFQKKCLAHIARAKPVLEEHRCDLWKQILRALVLAFTLPISLPLCALGFFSLKTDSATKLNGFENDLSLVRAG